MTEIINGPFSSMLGRSKGFEQGCINILFSKDMKKTIEPYEAINQHGGLSLFGKNVLEGMKKTHELIVSINQVKNNG